MVSKRIFYRSVVTVEVLSEAPLTGNESLSDLEYLIGPGPCSGKVAITTDNEQVDGRRMAQLLQAQASEPGFFGLDEQGRAVEGDEEREDSENTNAIPEALSEGSVSVELTGLAAMRQRRTIRLDSPLPPSAVFDLAKETAGSHVWEYLGMQEETIEVTLLS